MYHDLRSESCGRTILSGEEIIRVTHGRLSFRWRFTPFKGQTDYFHKNCDIAIRR